MYNTKPTLILIGLTFIFALIVLIAAFFIVFQSRPETDNSFVTPTITSVPVNRDRALQEQERKKVIDDWRPL